MRILSILLLAISWCFALHPNGVTHYQEITINAAQVAETNPHFPYQVKIPRGALVASACTSSTNVVVYKSTTDTTKSPKWTVYTSDTLFLYTDQPVSTSTGGSLVVGYGLNVNTVNSASTFTNCGVDNYWNMDTTSLPVIDMAGGVNLTLGTTWTQAEGVFNKGVVSTTSTDLLTDNISLFANKTAFTYSSVFKPTSFTGDNIYFSYRTSAGVIGFQLYYTPTKFIVYAGSISTFGQLPSSNPLTLSGNNLITVTYDGSQATNAEKLKLYINNTQQTLAFTGTIPTSIPSITGAKIGNGIDGVSVASPVGTIDEQCIAGDAATSACITTRYNMLFTPETFSTIGAVTSVPVTPNPHTDTLTFTCSATGATSYQWYIADTAVTGETDSVITIYADSAFYARKPTVYCMVSNGVESFVGFTWTFVQYLWNRLIGKFHTGTGMF